MPIKHFLDIGFTAVATECEYRRIEFQIYKIECIMDGTPRWHKAGEPCSPCWVDSLAEAEVYAHGEVRWDGCSNWLFDFLNPCMLHMCSREELVNIGEVLARCWDWALGPELLNE